LTYIARIGTDLPVMVERSAGKVNRKDDDDEGDDDRAESDVYACCVFLEAALCIRR
jgi:hypothetical protein